MRGVPGSRSGSGSFASWISILAHPFVMTGVMVAGSALHSGTVRDAAAALLLAGAAILPVAILMIRQVRRGDWENVDASNRAERPILFATGIVALAALLAFELAFRPGSFLIRGGVIVMIMLVICAIATRWIKVSLHMAFGALSATTLLLLGSPAGWILLAVLPLLAWSRLALSRHTVGELVSGAAAGALAAYAIVRL